MMRNCKNLFRDERGNISIIAAIGVVLLFGVMALSVDHGRNLTTQSDVSAKLLTLSKKAGDEYSYWLVRKEVNNAAGPLGQPMVSNLDPNIYILPDATISQAQALEALRVFIETELRRTNPEVSVRTPIIRFNSLGKRILSFTAQQPLKQDFVINKSSVPPMQSMNADILVNSYDENNNALQFVFSLDAESKAQINNAQLTTMLTLMRDAAGAIDPSYFKIYSSYMVGNLPNFGPSPPGNPDTVVAGGYSCNSSNSRADFKGFSGTCYDPDSGFNGPGYANPAVRKQTRNYKLEGYFVATDSAICNKPVWTYLNHPDNTCSLAYRYTWDDGDNEAPDPCTPPSPPSPPVEIPPQEVSIGGGGAEITVGVGTIDGIVTTSVPPTPPPPTPPPPPPPCNTCSRIK